MSVSRLYMQPKADDASHDEALSSRVAALNLMDISLEHLGVDVGKSVEEVEVVLKSCGESTCNSCHTHLVLLNRVWDSSISTRAIGLSMSSGQSGYLGRCSQDPCR